MDFESGAMVLAILLLSSNLFLVWGSTYLPNAEGNPMNFLNTVEESYSAEDVSLAFSQSDINSYLDSNIEITSSSPDIAKYGLSQANINFINIGAVLFGALLGTQSILLNFTSALGVQAVVGLAIIIVAVMTMIELIGIFYLGIRFFSLLRGGGGV